MTVDLYKAVRACCPAQTRTLPPMRSPTVVACFAAKSIAVSYAMEDPQAQLCGRTCTSVHDIYRNTGVFITRHPLPHHLQCRSPAHPPLHYYFQHHCPHPRHHQRQRLEVTPHQA